LHPHPGDFDQHFGPELGQFEPNINIVFIAIYCKTVGHLTNIYCPMVGRLIENLLKKSNAPPMPDTPPPLGLNIDRCIINRFNY
jgi:hypothetical protein